MTRRLASSQARLQVEGRSIPDRVEGRAIAGLRAPILLLIGEHEKLYSAQRAVDRVNKVVPQIEMEIIPQAGHALPLVRAELVNQKVLEFLTA
jgi:pimeloyl-ACP methyl ester carboxylesterase